jgi:AbiJ N-terminal domain 3
MEFSRELRKALLRNVARNRFTWSGGVGLLGFYGKLFDLNKLPSNDSRFKNAHDDMWQHTINNDDWSEADILDDARFSPLQLSDETFAQFIANALNVETRSKEELDKFVQVIRPILAHAGIQIVRYEEFGIFEGYKLSTRPEPGEKSPARLDAKRHTMRPAQRMSLIHGISTELQRRFTYNDIAAYLGAFDFPRPESPSTMA